MADISITASGVLAGSSALVEHGGKAGVTLVAGQVCYKDPADGKLKLSDSNGAAALKAAYGITLNGAALNQPVSVVKRGPVTLNGLTAGTTYCSSTTPGGIAPQADITTGGDVVILGVALSTTLLDLNINDTGVTL
jgi:hypothetical protein